MKFSGTSLDVVPAVLVRVSFADGDVYEYHKARARARACVRASACVRLRARTQRECACRL